MPTGPPTIRSFVTRLRSCLLEATPANLTFPSATFASGNSQPDLLSPVSLAATLSRLSCDFFPFSTHRSTVARVKSRETRAHLRVDPWIVNSEHGNSRKSAGILCFSVYPLTSLSRELFGCPSSRGTLSKQTSRLVDSTRSKPADFSDSQ